MLAKNTGSLYEVIMGHILTSILTEDFGTLDMVKHHPERNKAAQAFTFALTMALSEVLKGRNPQTGKGLEWPDSLNIAILGVDKKLSTEGISKLKEPYNMWALFPICDAACVTPSVTCQKGGANPAEQEARINKLELELHNLKSYIINSPRPKCMWCWNS